MSASRVLATRLLLKIFCPNIAEIKMPAPKKWNPAKLENDDIIAASIFRTTYGRVTDPKTRERVRGDFLLFRQLNAEYENPSDPSEIYILWIGQMKGWLEPGSIEEYVHMVGAPHDVVAMVEKQHANAFTGHAPDVADDELINFVRGADDKDHGSLYIMLCTGGHAVDCARLRPCQVTVTAEGMMSVIWHWTKSITKREQRNAQDYPPVMAPEARFIQTLGPDEVKTPWTSTAAAITKILHPTTTSLVFRRALDFRAAKLGYSKEERAALLSHQSTKMIKAHYGQRPTYGPKGSTATAAKKATVATAKKARKTTQH